MQNSMCHSRTSHLQHTLCGSVQHLPLKQRLFTVQHSLSWQHGKQACTCILRATSRRSALVVTSGGGLLVAGGLVAAGAAAAAASGIFGGDNPQALVRSGMVKFRQVCVYANRHTNCYYCLWWWWW